MPTISGEGIPVVVPLYYTNTEQLGTIAHGEE